MRGFIALAIRFTRWEHGCSTTVGRVRAEMLPDIAGKDGAPAFTTAPGAYRRACTFQHRHGCLYDGARRRAGNHCLETRIYQRPFEVRPDGKFSLPVIQGCGCSRKTPSQLADEITRKLGNMFKIPLWRSACGR